MRIIRGKNGVIRGAVIQILNEKLEEIVISIGSNAKKDNTTNYQWWPIPPITNDVEVEDCKSPDNLGFPESNLFGDDTEASKKIDSLLLLIEIWNKDFCNRKKILLNSMISRTSGRMTIVVDQFTNNQRGECHVFYGDYVQNPKRGFSFMIL